MFSGWNLHTTNLYNSLSLSGFTANMPTPSTYMHQIFNFIPPTINQIVHWLNQPIVIVMVIICIVLGFIFALLDNK